MDVYEIRIDSRVEKELRFVPARDRKRIFAAIEALRKQPRPSVASRLVGQPGWRIRVGDYRILYEIDDEQLLVTVYRAGHRSDVYRFRR